MTTSPLPSILSELESGEPLSEGTLAYFRERQRNRVHELVLEEFLKSGMNKADFARRIGRKPEQITRWLAAPGNWELDTISDFLLGISGAEFRPGLSYPTKEIVQDHSGPDWLSPSAPARKQERPSLEELLGRAELKKVLEIDTGVSQQRAAQRFALDEASLPVRQEGPSEPMASNDNMPYKNRLERRSALQAAAL